MQIAALTGGPRRSWVAGFLLIFTILGSWSLATPKYAAPDEPAQAFRAASLVRGQLLGNDAGIPSTSPSVLVRVPATLTGYSPSCFAFKPSVAASCMPNWSERPGSANVQTYTGRYPPLYYLAVGLPSLFYTGGSMLLWMRLAGDLMNALFLTAAFVLAGRGSRSPWGVVGCAAAVTPMVLFVGSVINPSGLEICSAITLWSSLLALLRSPEGAPARSLLVWAVLSAAVFESTRGLSPALMLITVAAVVAMARRSQLRELARRRDVRVAGAIVGGIGVIGLTWTLIAGALRLSPVDPVSAGASLRAIVRLALVKNLEVSQLVGNFGWVDTPSPLWVIALWVAIVFGLIILVAVNGSRRELIVMALVALACVAIPTAGDVTQARTIGLISQGRYILPLAVGVPLIAGMTLRGSGGRVRLVAYLVLGLLALAQIRDFLRALQRYRTGVPAPQPLPHGEWTPPLGTPLLITVFIIATVGLQLWFGRLAADHSSGFLSNAHQTA